MEVTWYNLIPIICFAAICTHLVMSGDQKYEAEYMEADEFYQTFKVFKEHLKEEGPSLIVQEMKNHNFGNKSELKWLSIGTGYGDMEMAIFQGLEPDLKISKMTSFEPGDEQYKHLKNVDFGLETLLDLHHGAFDETTHLGEEKFDVISMFHVHYYWTDPGQRISVMKKLFDHLEPGGLLLVLILDEGAKDQIEMRRAAKSRLTFSKARHYKSCTLYGTQLIEEMNLDGESVELKKWWPYQVSLDLHLQDSANVTKQLMSYILSIRFEKLEDDMQDFVLNWIRSHCQKIGQEIFQIRQAVSLIVYTKNI